MICSQNCESGGLGGQAPPSPESVMCWATWPLMPVGMVIEGNQKLEPPGSEEFE
jgi:hypothetical protein